MRGIAVYGTGGLGREAVGLIWDVEAAEERGYEFVGFFDDCVEPGSEVGHHGRVLGVSRR